MAKAFRFKFNKDLIEYQAATRGDKPYILHEGKVLTFRDYNFATRRAANGIKAQS